jgi:hypothetical protein
MLIYALTKEGRELVITVTDEPWCLAYGPGNGNPYPCEQAEADARGLTCHQRDLRYHIEGVGWRSTWTDIEEVYARYLRDPIVWALTEHGEYSWPDGRLDTDLLPASLLPPPGPIGVTF